MGFIGSCGESSVLIFVIPRVITHLRPCLLSIPHSDYPVLQHEVQCYVAVAVDHPAQMVLFLRPQRARVDFEGNVAPNDPRRPFRQNTDPPIPTNPTKTSHKPPPTQALDTSNLTSPLSLPSSLSPPLTLPPNLPSPPPPPFPPSPPTRRIRLNPLPRNKRKRSHPPCHRSHHPRRSSPSEKKTGGAEKGKVDGGGGGLC